MRQVKAAKLEELQKGQMLAVTLEGQRLVVFRDEAGQVSALADCCSHAEVRLSGGTYHVTQGQVECPAHGARFDVRTGRQVRMPAVSPVKRFEVTIEGEDVFVHLP